MPEHTQDWNQRYATGDIPWDSGEVSAELKRILGEGRIDPCRTLELGCGTGTNAVYLASRGFTVTAFDISPLAIDQAKTKSREAGASIDFFVADVLRLPELGPPFPCVFDRGLYHIVRRNHLEAFQKVLANLSQPGGWYLVLAGNANEANPPEGGPPRVHAHEMCLELGGLFELVQLREFRFDGVKLAGQEIQPLAWSGLWRRKA